MHVIINQIFLSVAPDILNTSAIIRNPTARYVFWDEMFFNCHWHNINSRLQILTIHLSGWFHMISRTERRLLAGFFYPVSFSLTAIYSHCMDYSAFSDQTPILMRHPTIYIDFMFECILMSECMSTKYTKSTRAHHNLHYISISCVCYKEILHML